MNEDSHTYLGDKADYGAYMRTLDEDGNYDHRHEGIPTRYPCLVCSTFWDDPNGPYTYFHSFTYREELEDLLRMFYSPQEIEAHDAAQESL